MKRLVYTPSIHAWVKTDTGVFDLSPYITDFNVDRRVNQTSYAEITFRNPKDKNGNFVFTEAQGVDGSVRPMFHPMDPIIITLTRLKGRPVQVFTGYCDTTPYVQLQPGLARLTASCTIKRLLYTYWDPALPFVRDFMAQNGWGIAADGTSFNSTAEGASQIVTNKGQTELVSGQLNDTSIGKLLYRLLVDVGNWDPGNVYIQELPGKNITQLVTNLYKDTVNEEASSINEFHNFLQKVIGAGAYGKAGSVVAGPDGKPLLAPSQQDLADYEKALKIYGSRAALLKSASEKTPRLKGTKLNLLGLPDSINLSVSKIKDIETYISIRDTYYSPVLKDAYNSSKWSRWETYGTGTYLPIGSGPVQPIFSIGDGTVVKSGKISNNLNGVVIKMEKPFKVNGKNYSYVTYGNLNLGKIPGMPPASSHSNNEVGTKVTKGSRIGFAATMDGKSDPGVVIGITGQDGDFNNFPLGAQSDSLYNAMNGVLKSASWEEGGSYGKLNPTAAGYPLPAPYDNDQKPTTEQTATAAAFSSYFQMPGIMEMSEAVTLTGKRSLLNDKPLFSFVEQVAAGSLRSFMSMPNGNFYAFYPDYFGGLGRNPYWEIKDIEIMSGGIELSDDALATHVFVVGDTQPSGGPLGYGTIDWIDKINTAGVVNVLNAFAADFINGPPDPAKPNAYSSAGGALSDKGNAINFLKKYGARPITEEMPVIRSPIYETFVAYQRFCLLWSQQFKTTFEFTFMPELYPGGIVAFPEHGLQCYVDAVTHTGSYESGFRTVASLIAPSALKDGSGNAVDSKKSWVHNGMIRAFSFNADNLAHPVSSYNSPASNPKPRSGG